MHGVLEWAFLVVAGTVAGVIGTAGGITSLASYPALLAIGIPPLAGNVTNSVAILGSGLSSAVQAGPDVTGHSQMLKRWLPVTALLSLGGAILLIATPGAVFNRIVPFLVAGGSLVILFQPQISRWQQRRGHQLHPASVALWGAGVAIYNGYFGAGSGILLIALLMLTTEPVLHRANSLKNVILVVSDVLPAVLFAAVGRVVWHAVWPLALGALVGGRLGPKVARRVPAAVMRILIATCGFALVVYLALDT